jgi:hypothetical protein
VKRADGGRVSSDIAAALAAARAASKRWPMACALSAAGVAPGPGGETWLGAPLAAGAAGDERVAGVAVAVVPVPSTGGLGALLSMCAPTPGGPLRSCVDVHAAITSQTTAQGRLT